jgi:hypothetical protein
LETVKRSTAESSRGCTNRWFAKIPRSIFWKSRTWIFELFPERNLNQPQHLYNTAKMPKSKRAKVVHLTKTDKKGKELSLKLFANVQEAADNFEHIFVFAVENMRNSYLKEVRQEFADSRYVHGIVFAENAHG